MPGGYVFNLDSPEALLVAVTKGVYGTVLSQQPVKDWGRPGEGTFGDYASMRPGDSVYFFNNRRLYGVGRLTPVAGDVVHLNFPDASLPQTFEYENVKSHVLYDSGPTAVRQRWICTFEPDPAFFDDGIDMDDVLSSAPSAFRMLRVMWKLSFVKLDVEENAALKDAIIRANRGSFPLQPQKESSWGKVHSDIAQRRTSEYDLDVAPLLSAAATGLKSRHEMAIESAILRYLTRGDSDATAIFGSWDYLSHQVVASPFKPPDWMDKMDLFGAAFVPEFAPTLAALLVGEVKKDNAGPADVDQLMKYVDWVRDEYAHGDYSLIKAFLVAADFSSAAVEQRDEMAIRFYTVGLRPVQSKVWKSLSLVRYRFDADEQRLKFELV